MTDQVKAATIYGGHYLWVATLKSPYNGNSGVVMIAVSPREETAHDAAREAIRADMKRAGYAAQEIDKAATELVSNDGLFEVNVGMAAYRP